MLYLCGRAITILHTKAQGRCQILHEINFMVGGKFVKTAKIICLKNTQCILSLHKYN